MNWCLWRRVRESERCNSPITKRAVIHFDVCSVVFSYRLFLSVCQTHVPGGREHSCFCPGCFLGCGVLVCKKWAISITVKINVSKCTVKYWIWKAIWAGRCFNRGVPVPTSFPGLIKSLCYITSVMRSFTNYSRSHLIQEAAKGHSPNYYGHC